MAGDVADAATITVGTVDAAITMDGAIAITAVIGRAATGTDLPAIADGRGAAYAAPLQSNPSSTAMRIRSE